MLNQHNDIKEDLVLIAGPRTALYENSKVFNLQLFGPVLHVQLDPYIHKNFRLMKIYHEENCSSVCRYDYDELGHPWIDIPVDVLDRCIGLHTYIIEFINVITGDTFYQYFNYTIQNDNPCKPYIYMER